ncbi:MAG: hypothetical protein ACI4ML_04570 [Aristaeellaceae bacterium]
MKDKPRVSRHNGRAGKHGVYNPKHNDRSFDVENAENISKDRTSLNLYWDCINGLRTHEENSTGQYPSFTQHEHDEYERRYGHYVAEQNKRNIKAGHAKRNRTVDDLLADARICPEETIYQIGKEGDCPPPEVLTAIVTEFFATIEEHFGEHVHVLDWALHLDETSPHIHARQVFDVVNRYGEREPKQEKALETLGIPLPEPDKKPSRVNNRKITFDKICRELLLGICQEHGLSVETEAIYGGRESREKNDYIIETQREKIAELEKRNAELTADNERQSRLLAKTTTELDEKQNQLADAATVLEAVSDAAYDQAVKVVAHIAVDETQKADQSIVDKMINMTADPERRMKPKERDLIAFWLRGVKDNIVKRAAKVVTTVLSVLQKPEYRRAAKDKIKETASPAVSQLLRAYERRLSCDKAVRRDRNDDAR